MLKNKFTIILYLLIILVAAVPALNAMGERQPYAHASVLPTITPVQIRTSTAESENTPTATDEEVEVAASDTTQESNEPPADTPTADGTDAANTALTQPELEESPTPEAGGTGPVLTNTVAGEPTATATQQVTQPPPNPSLTPSTPPTSSQPYNGPPPDQWAQWPILPERLSPDLIALYQKGITRGNNPHAFSVMGDCQSIPDVFMGIYEQDPDYVADLPLHLQETVTQFTGSFDRYSPTVKDGTTEGALLWAQWNDNLAGFCNDGETPVDCELRYHKPSIVFIHVGTHWEARNRDYLLTIINKVMQSGAVPIMVTKADNRELDGRVNRAYAELAAQYNLPLWNFWASVQDLPNHGLEEGSDMYLSEEGIAVHREGALEVLSTVWRLAEGE